MVDRPLSVPCLEQFYQDGLITRDVRTLRSGKEATVYRCVADVPVDLIPTAPSVPLSSVPGHLAAKVYRERASRGFRSEATYLTGRLRPGKRSTRAIVQRSRLGKRMLEGLWVSGEFETLQRLHEAGADVPTPAARTSRAILMSFVGTDGEPAPALREARLDPTRVRRVLDRILDNVDLFLGEGIVHGDLSPYNILMVGEDPVIIDFPQAVRAASNPSAFELLVRDVAGVCDFAARFGVHVDAWAVAGSMWRRHRHA